MRCRVCFRGATTIAFVARGAFDSADLEPAGALAPAPWNWSGGYLHGRAGGGYRRDAFSNPYLPSHYGGVAPMYQAAVRSALTGGRIARCLVSFEARGAVHDGTKCRPRRLTEADRVGQLLAHKPPPDKPAAAKPLVFQLMIAASRAWRLLKGTKQLPNVAVFRVNDGIETERLISSSPPPE